MTHSADRHLRNLTTPKAAAFAGVLFALLFVALALSSFGLFELQLPHKLRSLVGVLERRGHHDADHPAGAVDADAPYVRGLLGRLPEDFTKLTNLGSYGAWLQIWLCQVNLIFTAPGGQEIVWNNIDTTGVKQNPGGRCDPR